MSNELVASNNYAVMPVMELETAVQRFSQLAQFVGKIMRQGTDFGAIPGTDKPTLLKPGAEKLTTFFGLSPEFTPVEKETDWTGNDHGGEPFFYFQYRCRLSRGGLLVGEGVGSCNSWEAKYRYRNARPVCPNCGAEAISRSKFAPKNKPDAAAGWYCRDCKAQFNYDAPEITGQPLGKVKHDNPADIVNTIDKMAQKRALIAATLIAVNASEFFTQDMEDYVTADYIDITPAETIPPHQQEKKQNGNGKQIDTKKPFKFLNSAQEKFWKTVQDATGNGYRNPYHLDEVVNIRFNFADENEWNARLSAAVDHISAKRQEVNTEAA